MDIISQIDASTAAALAVGLALFSAGGLAITALRLLAELRRTREARRQRDWEELLRDWREIKQDPKDTLR